MERMRLIRDDIAGRVQTLASELGARPAVGRAAERVGQSAWELIGLSGPA